MKIKKILFIIFSINLIFISYSYAKFITTYSINSEEVDKIIEKIDKQTLIVIDLDSLVMPRSKLFLPSSPYRRLIDSMVSASNNSSTYKNILANWYSNRKIKLVEEEWKDFIENMQKRGATVVGLCEMNQIIYSSFKEPEVWKYNEIKNLGIKFTDKIGAKDMFQIVTQKFKQSLFYHGIIFTGLFPKAYILENFLMVSNLMPRTLIIFDSNQDRLDEMEIAMRSINLDFYAINYKKLLTIENKIDENIAKFQEESLLYKGVWLEDEEAMEALNTTK